MRADEAYLPQAGAPTQVFSRPASGVCPIAAAPETAYRCRQVQGKPFNLLTPGTRMRPFVHFRASQVPPMTLKILLIDDNRTFIAAVRHFLDRLAGVTVVGQAHDGKAALAHVRDGMPDVVLLDIAMPGMNGLELARALRLHPAPPRIIFLSMHDNQEYRAAARELGAGFVSKADFVNELIPTLETMALVSDGGPADAGHLQPPDRVSR